MIYKSPEVLSCSGDCGSITLVILEVLVFYCDSVGSLELSTVVFGFTLCICVLCLFNGSCGIYPTVLPKIKSSLIKSVGNQNLD